MATTMVHRTIEEILEAIGNRTPRVLAFGHDLDLCAYVHFKSLSDDGLRMYSGWAGSADMRIDIDGFHEYGELKQEAIKRWPNVKVYRFRCTCCGSEDLIAENQCGYCEQLHSHLDGCPLLVTRQGPAHPGDPQMQAHNLFMRGYTAGFHGHRCGEKSATGRLGYRKGREDRKNRFAA